MRQPGESACARFLQRTQATSSGDPPWWPFADFLSSPLLLVLLLYRCYRCCRSCKFRLYGFAVIPDATTSSFTSRRPHTTAQTPPRSPPSHRHQQPAAVFGDGFRISCAKCSKLRRDPPPTAPGRPAKACTKKERYWFCESCVTASPEAFTGRGIGVCRPDGKWKMATVRVSGDNDDGETMKREL